MILPHRRLSHAQGYLGLGMLAEAEDELARIEEPWASSAPVLAVRVTVLQERKDWARARDCASAWVRLEPGEPASWISWAYATRRADSLPAAQEILRDAVRHHPEEPTIQFNLGCYACQRGDLSAARTYVDRAIALDDKFRELAATDPDLAPLRAGGLSAPGVI